MKIAMYILLGALRCYRWIVSPVLDALFRPMGFGCRYEPTCSQYAMEAVRCHGAARGSVLALRRVCRCHPWGGWGQDPVPTVGVPLVHPGERDRSGRFRGRPAGGRLAEECLPGGRTNLQGKAFGGTPKTAGETPALPF